jgi:hypothetical protein
MWKLLGFLGFWTKTHKDNGSKCQPWAQLWYSTAPGGGWDLSNDTVRLILIIISTAGTAVQKIKNMDIYTGN